MACVPPALKAFCFLPFITTAIDYIVGILVIVDVDLLVSTSGCSVHYYYSLLTLTSILGYFVVTFSSVFFYLPPSLLSFPFAGQSRNATTAVGFGPSPPLRSSTGTQQFSSEFVPLPFQTGTAESTVEFPF